LVIAIVAALAADDLDGLLLNIGTEFIGGAVTFLLLEQVIGTRRLKVDLVAQMGSQVNDVALHAVEQLRLHG